MKKGFNACSVQNLFCVQNAITVWGTNIPWKKYQVKNTIFCSILKTKILQMKNTSGGKDHGYLSKISTKYVQILSG